MVRDLTEWAEGIKRDAAILDASLSRSGAPYAHALAAVLRAVAAEHPKIDLSDEPGGYPHEKWCQKCRTLCEPGTRLVGRYAPDPWPCPTVAAVLAALAPLAPCSSTPKAAAMGDPANVVDLDLARLVACVRGGRVAKERSASPCPTCGQVLDHEREGHYCPPARPGSTEDGG